MNLFARRFGAAIDLMPGRPFPCFAGAPVVSPRIAAGVFLIPSGTPANVTRLLSDRQPCESSDRAEGESVKLDPLN
jgi:hypothetical protein